MSGWIFPREGPPRLYEELPDPKQILLHTFAYDLNGTYDDPKPLWVVVRYPTTLKETQFFSIREKGWYSIDPDKVPKHLKAWLLILEIP